MDTVLVKHLRDKIFGKITTYNSKLDKRTRVRLSIRLDNDVIIDTKRHFLLWDDANECCYYLSFNAKQTETVGMMGDGEISYPAMVGAFGYGEIQEIWSILTKDAFGQACSVINANASGARTYTMNGESKPITDKLYDLLYRTYVRGAEYNPEDDSYAHQSTLVIHKNDGTDTKSETKNYFVDDLVVLPKAKDYTSGKGTLIGFNTKPDGFGNMYEPGKVFKPTFTHLELYAIWKA